MKTLEIALLRGAQRSLVGLVLLATLLAASWNASAEGASSQDYVRKNFPRAEIVALNTTNQTAPFIEVAWGRVDVGINDTRSAKRFAANQRGVRDMFATSYDPSG